MRDPLFVAGLAAGGKCLLIAAISPGRKYPAANFILCGDLAAFGPRSAADYEQLLNRQPNSSELWIQYMAYQMQSSELTEARKVAERAVVTINSTEETEKLNAWVAFLNLEVRFGNDETVDDVFKRALQVNDQQEVYQRLATIYIQDKPEVRQNQPKLPLLLTDPPNRKQMICSRPWSRSSVLPRTRSGTTTGTGCTQPRRTRVGPALFCRAHTRHCRSTPTCP